MFSRRCLALNHTKLKSVKNLQHPLSSVVFITNQLFLDYKSAICMRTNFTSTVLLVGSVFFLPFLKTVTDYLCSWLFFFLQTYFELLSSNF